jgi:hypothetical protein
MRNTIALSAVLALVGCGGSRAVDNAQQHDKKTSLVNTYVGEYVEIDEINGGPGNANLQVDGNTTPATSDPSPTWTDWTNIDPTGHRFLDVSDPDTSSFPRSNSCVGTSKVLSKMDLTYVGLANNQEYAYFAVQRSNNNGDAGYYWLMTKLAPAMKGPVAPCKAGESLLEYTISPGDVLLAGHFKPSSDPLLRVFIAQKGATMDGVAAINYLDTSLWLEDNSVIAAVAVNTSNTAPGTWGSAGVAKQALASNGDLEPQLFAEAAIKTSLFTGGNICGAKFYGTVITRSSGSGGTTPDLKDFFGPEEFSFGDVSAEMELTGTCEETFKYCAKLKGIDGQPVQSPTCAWTIVNKATGSPITPPTDCCGTFTVAPGTYDVSVKVTDSGSPCSETKGPQTIKVYPKLTATASLTPTCTSTFDYAGQGNDGKAPYTYAWSFSGSSNPSTSSTQSGTVSVGLGNGNKDYNATLTITDSRGCKATDTKTTKPYDPVLVALGVKSVANVCSADLDTAVFQAAYSGGNGSYGFAWSVVGADGFGCSPGTGASCTIDPSDSNMCASAEITVTLSDSSGLCSPALSNPVKYEKTTTVTASVVTTP